MNFKPLIRSLAPAFLLGWSAASLAEDFAFHQTLVALTECDALISCFERVVNLSLFHQTALISPMQPITYDRHLKLLDDLAEASSAEKAESRIRQHLRRGKESLFENQLTTD